MQELEPLPAHWKCYLQAFDRLLDSSSDTEARVQRRRMDKHLSHALTRDGVGHEREKRKSSLESSEPVVLPARLSASLGRGRTRRAA